MSFDFKALHGARVEVREKVVALLDHDYGIKVAKPLRRDSLVDALHAAGFKRKPKESAELFYLRFIANRTRKR